MKQIKAVVHRHRVADVVHALDAAGFRHVNLFDVKGLSHTLAQREQEYSVELGDKVVGEVQIEIFCEDSDVSRATDLVRRNARTGQADGGWIHVSAVEQSLPINGEP